MNALLSFGPGFIILILGIFLVLAAIVGGGLEIKEIRIPKIEKTPRILTAILGLMVMLCGVGVTAFSFFSAYMSPKLTPVSPTAIAGNHTPNTDYINVDKIKLPHETGISDAMQQAAAELIVNADKAEISAIYYQDDSYLIDYYAGDALKRLQQGIEEARQSGYTVLEDIDLDSSYYVSMSMNNNILSIDECEYWKTYFYDPSTGELVKETEWNLVPQTISIEALGDRAYITAISFYQNEAFCTK